MRGLAYLAAGVASAAFLFPVASMAQTTAGTNGGQASASTADAAAEVVVTGSRAVRNGASAPTPVTTLTAQALTQTAPSNIPDALNQLPEFQLSANQYRSTTFNATGGLQGNYLNLRGLGPQRVLILLDGSRVPPTSSTNAVDSNILPQMLIERVDVVTGGASAAYGSDAVSGVVNYILNKHFNGVQAVAQRGISTYGDAASYRFGIAAGTGFAGGRGHIEFSAERYKNDGIPRQDDRPYYQDFGLLVGTGTPASPFTQILNSRYNDITFGGLIRSGPLAGKTFNPDGSLSTFVVNPPAAPSSNVAVGGAGAYVPPTVLVPHLLTNQAFGRASFDVTDSLSLYAQASYGRSETGYLSSYPSRRGGTASGTTIFADNPYLTPTVVAALGSTPSFTISRYFSDAPGNQQRSVTTSYNVQAGLTGKIGSNFDWDVAYTHGDAKLKLSQVEQNNRNYYAAVDAVRSPTGQIVCRVTLVNPSLVPGCVPLNILGLGNLDPKALAFIDQPSISQIENKLDVVAANLRGDILTLPGGPLSFAVGAEARWQSLNQTSNANPALPVDYTGIRGVPTGVLPFASTNVGIASGKQNVKEAYLEINAPLLKDLPLVHRLDLNAAGRVTDYKTSGSVETWKVGAVYEPVAGLRFRSTLSRDIAAPSLFDLFGGAQVTLFSMPDIHTNSSGTFQQVSSGNPNLKPERATTVVAGVVLNPSFAHRLTVSVDGYQIHIKDAIGASDATFLVNDCEASGGTGPSCAFVKRPLPFSDRTAANFPTQINVAPLNLAVMRVKGIDTEINYSMPLDSLGLPGSLELRAFGSYLAQYNTQANLTAPLIHRAGHVSAVASTSGLPRLRGTFQEGYRNGGTLVQLTERATGHYSRTNTESFDPTYVHAPNRWYTDFYASQEVASGRLTLFLKVDNMFNVSPPFLSASVNPGFTYPTDKFNYDILGRYFTVGAKFKF